MIPYCIMVIEDDNDREFMTSLYINYKNLMFSEICKIVKTDFDADDVMQDVLEKLIDKIPLLRSRNRDQLVNYIISACKYTALNYIRDNRDNLQTTFDDFLDLYDSDHDGHEIELHIIRDEELQALRRILSQMDERSQCLLKGYYFLNKSTSELGAELGIKPDSIRMLLTRARKKAFELLQKDIGVEIVGNP